MPANPFPTLNDSGQRLAQAPAVPYPNKSLFGGSANQLRPNATAGIGPVIESPMASNSVLIAAGVFIAVAYVLFHWNYNR